MSTDGSSHEDINERARLWDGPDNQSTQSAEHIHIYMLPKKDPFPVSTRLFMVGMAVLITFLTAGVIFGFAALKPVMIDEGAYSYLCKKGEKECAEQRLKLDLMFTAAAFAINCAAFPVGLLLDEAGPRMTSICGTVFEVTGLILLAYSSKHFDGYIPGYVCIAIGGLSMFLAHINLINLFPSYMGTINGIITGAFDTSSLVPMIFKVLHFYNGVPLHLIWLSYLVVPAVNFLFGIVYLDERQYQSEPEASKDDEGREKIPKIYSLQHLPVAKQLRTVEYFLVASFISIYMLRINFYIATVAEQLTDLCDFERVPMLTDAFNVILPIGGIITIPLVGFILDRHGPTAMYLLLAILLVVFGVFGVVPIWWLQIVNFCVLVVARTCLYAAISDFCGRVFGFKTFGTTYGLLMMISAFVNLLQYPLDKLVTNTLKGDFFWVNAGLTILSCLCFLFPLYLWREKKTRFGAGVLVYARID